MTRQNFNWKLPREIDNRLGTRSYGAQRAICEQEHLLLVAHQPPKSESNAREHAVFLRRPTGEWLHNGVEHGERALAELIDQYEARLTALESRYSAAETADDLFQVMDALLPIARAATNLKDAVQAARDMVKDDKLLIDLRDRAVDIARGFELLLANARIAVDYRLARQAEAQTQAAMGTTRAQTKLNVIAALTVPLMTLATVFGMNLRSGMESGPSWWFWAVFAGGIAFGLAARGWVMPAQAPDSGWRVRPPRAMSGAAVPSAKKSKGLGGRG